MSISIPMIKVVSLFEYFGYKHVTTKQGVWWFQSKKWNNQVAIFQPGKRLPDGSITCLGRLEFKTYTVLGEMSFNKSTVKTWKGLFTAVRTHTKMLIFRSEVKKAA